MGASLDAILPDHNSLFVSHRTKHESQTTDHTFLGREKHICARGVVQVITYVQFLLFRSTFTDYNFATPALGVYKKNTDIGSPSKGLAGGSVHYPSTQVDHVPMISMRARRPTLQPWPAC